MVTEIYNTALPRGRGRRYKDYLMGVARSEPLLPEKDFASGVLDNMLRGGHQRFIEQSHPTDRSRDGTPSVDDHYISFDFTLSGYREELPIDEVQVNPEKVFGAKHRLLARPYLAVLAGEYGMGKTTFVRRLIEARSERPALVYPVNLAHLDHSRRFAFDWADLVGSRDDGPPSTVRPRDVLEAAVKRGDVLLALDGLDELAREQGDFDKFFAHLFHLLGASDGVRVLVTVRREFLSASCGITNLDVLRERIAPHKVQNLYYLQLNGFKPEGLEAYLQRRNCWQPIRAKCAELGLEFEQLAVHDLLCRPLLARLFCDWIDLRRKDTREAGADTWDEIVTIRGRVSLLKRFLGGAVADWRVLGLKGPPAEPEPFWDQTKLAALALAIYSQHGGLEFAFTREQARACVNPVIYRLDLPAEFGDPIDWVVHKCPFLIRVPMQQGIGEFEFAHRVFLEYYTALGVWIDENRDDAPRDVPNAFDDLVLNVDMRKFLRELAKDDKKPDDEDPWFKKTGRAYRLLPEPEEPDKEWRWTKEWALTNNGWHPTPDERAELDRNRRYLLAVMTYPDEPGLLAEEIERIDQWVKRTRPGRSPDESLAQESAPPSGQLVPSPYERIAGEIDQFLEKYESRWRHPRYLIPCFEPIAVFLQERGRAPNWTNLYATFRRILEEHARVAAGVFLDPLRQPAGRNTWYRAAYALLLERCLNIALRLRFPWVRGQAKRLLTEGGQVWPSWKTSNAAAEPWTEGAGDEVRTRDRVRQLCETISQAVGWPVE